MKPAKLIVNTKSIKYPIIIGNHLISNIKKIFNQNFIKFEKCLIVVDKNVPKKIINKIKKSFKEKNIFFYYFNPSEKNKNQNSTNKIINYLLEKNFSRQDCLIAVGGGITGDITGFAASLFKRGIQFINIPTTLLAQVDSSIGGKTGVNTKYGKNLIGSFFQPKLVISDISFLKSLPKREIVCGYGEILKHSLIADKNFYKFLKKNVLKILDLKSPYIENSIYKSCKIKKFIVEKDETENSLRKILNLGHTFAHSYEATLNYSKKLNHGEAVLLGVNTAVEFSYINKFLKKDEYYSIIDHLKSSNLPSQLKKFFSIKDLNKLLNFMTKDKKNDSNNINLILLKKIGAPFLKNYQKNKIEKFLRDKLIN